MTQFLIDSGAFLALLDTRDKYHPAAASFIQTHQGALFYLPELIFSETLTLIKSRLGPKPAIKLGESIQQSNQFQIVLITEMDRQLTWEIFRQFDDKGWSFADCSILAVARRLQLFKVFSFDYHITQMSELNRVPQ